MAQAFPGWGGGEDPLLPGPFQPGLYLGPDTGCPPEFADVPVQELFAEIDATRQQRAAAAGESLAAGFRPRGPLIPSQSGSGFESGGALDTSPPSGTLAGLAEAISHDGGLAAVDDDELIGVLRAWQRIESWASANGLAAIAELARRRPAPGIPPAPPCPENAARHCDPCLSPFLPLFKSRREGVRGAFAFPPRAPFQAFASSAR